MRNLLLVVVLMCISVNAQPQVLSQKLDSIRLKYNVVGMSVSIVKGAAVVYTQGFGLRDVGLNKEMTDSTKYRIASISKSISAIALMTLYEKGLFSLNDDVSKHLGFTLRNPNFPNDTITIGMVLSHTASLRDGTGYDGFLTASYNDNPPPAISELLVPGGSSYTSDVFSSAKGPKDAYFQYSNINYGVIGTLVEKLSGKRFDQYCKEVIFDKLGIEASFNVSDFASVDNIAALYRKSGSSWAVQADGFAGVKPAPRDLSGYTIGSNGLVFAPQGGLRISSTDLAQVMSLLINKGVVNGVRILNEQTTTLMLTPLWNYTSGNGNNYYGLFNSYGTGISKTTELLPGEELFGHAGEAYGLISDSYFSVKGNYGIVFITNGGEWGFGNYSGWYNVEEDVYKACIAEINANSLPVELTSFSASVNGTTVSLNWATATELNNKGFEVQRRTNGSDFITVGFIEGKGTTTDANEYGFNDQVVAGEYTYRLKQVDFDGSFEYSKEINVDVNSINTFELAQNYPNPFNPSTKISFSLAKDSNVKLTVFNTLGEEVAVLVNSTLTAGNHSVDFNATNLTSGMYLYKIQAGEFVSVKKMILMK